MKSSVYLLNGFVYLKKPVYVKNILSESKDTRLSCDNAYKIDVGVAPLSEYLISDKNGLDIYFELKDFIDIDECKEDDIPDYIAKEIRSKVGLYKSDIQSFIKKSIEKNIVDIMDIINGYSYEMCTLTNETNTGNKFCLSYDTNEMKIVMNKLFKYDHAEDDFEIPLINIINFINKHEMSDDYEYLGAYPNLFLECKGAICIDDFGGHIYLGMIDDEISIVVNMLTKENNWASYELLSMQKDDFFKYLSDSITLTINNVNNKINSGSLNEEQKYDTNKVLKDIILKYSDALIGVDTKSSIQKTFEHKIENITKDITNEM